MNLGMRTLGQDDWHVINGRNVSKESLDVDIQNAEIVQRLGTCGTSDYANAI